MPSHNIHRHPHEQRISLALADDGPPVVEKDFERPPQCHPATDHQTLAQNRSQVTRSHLPGNHLTQAKQRAQERQADEEADPAATQQNAQLAVRQLQLAREMFVNRFLEIAGFVRFATRSVEVDDDGPWRLRELSRAGDDVLLGVDIEVALIERARVQGIEELRHFPEVQIDAPAAALGSLRGGRRGNSMIDRALSAQNGRPWVAEPMQSSSGIESTKFVRVA
jgi:hypothetical protein